jgi:hypothetical protein
MFTAALVLVLGSTGMPFLNWTTERRYPSGGERSLIEVRVFSNTPKQSLERRDRSKRNNFSIKRVMYQLPWNVMKAALPSFLNLMSTGAV